MPPSEQEIAQSVMSALGTLTSAQGAGQSEYALANQEFQGLDRFDRGVVAGVGEVFGAFGGTAPTVPRQDKKPYVTSSSGKVKYPNGVIYDPATGTVLYPPQLDRQADMAGSEAWLREVQEKWSDDKANEWRKKLWEQGYQGANMLQSDKGGWGHDLLNALRSYHTNRYANFGRVQKLAPTSLEAKQGIRSQVDKVQLRADVKTWGQAVFGEDLNDDEAEFFSDRILDVAARLMRQKDWTADAALQGAQTRVQQQFVKQDEVKDALEMTKEQEENTALRDKIINVAQIASM